MFDHEMNIQRQFGAAPRCCDHQRAKADVGHEMAVHNIAMNPVRAGALRLANLTVQVREISCKDGGSEDDVIQRH